MARAPAADGKSRLASHLTPERLTDLKAALLQDAIDVVRSTGFDARLFVTPESALDGMRRLAPGLVCVAQRGEDLGSRMSAAIADMFAAGYDAVALVGTDVPQLTADDVRAAADLVDRDVLVLGPSADGGYYLVASARHLPALFEGIEWGSATVLSETMARATAEALDVSLLRTLTDLDTPDDLRALRTSLDSASGDVAPAFRRWLAESAAS